MQAIEQSASGESSGELLEDPEELLSEHQRQSQGTKASEQIADQLQQRFTQAG